MKKGDKRRVYSEEFKSEAVAMAESNGRTQSDVARSLSISLSALNRWCAESKPLDSDGLTMKELSEENKRLTSELKRLKLEQEILKKAAAYFAKNQA